MTLRLIVALLECGHEGKIHTSFARLSKGRLGCILGHYARTGLFCDKCKATCLVIKYLKLESYKV